MFDLPRDRYDLSRTSCCLRCRMFTALCLCGRFDPIILKTRVVVFMHTRELCLQTNTGQLARLVLANSDLVLRGKRDRTVVAPDAILDPGRKAYLLFPEDTAEELTADFVTRQAQPITLVCPDGHWGQASKMIRREPALKDLPRVKLPPGPPSNYRLRRNILPGRVCTYEAIARALGVLEGVDVQTQMEHIFEMMVTRLLWGRGRLGNDELVL